MADGAIFSIYKESIFGLAWSNSKNKRVKGWLLKIKRETCVFGSLDSITIPLCAENRVFCDNRNQASKFDISKGSYSKMMLTF